MGGEWGMPFAAGGRWLRDGPRPSGWHRECSLPSNRGRWTNMLFRNRTDAGRQLAERLTHYAGRPDVVVLALPRGGVPVGYEVARALEAPLDVFVVRKLGVPGHEELAMGAVASGGAWVLNDDVVGPLAVPDHVIRSVAARELQELARRERLYRGD